MNKNQILNPKTHKYTIYGLIILTIIMLITFLVSCDNQPRQPNYAKQQAPLAYEQPVEYKNEVHYYDNNDTATNLAAAAAVGAAAGYATNKYMDKQKQKQTITPTYAKVNPTKVPVNKPSFSYTTSKPSSVYRSTSSKSTRRK